MIFKEVLQQKTIEAEQIVMAYMPSEDGYQKTVMDAMKYSVSAGGKRLRPVLMKESYLLFGGKGKEIEPFMAAMEMIHTYSLIHDDLPAMDNDEFRRGKKTTWVEYGEAMAILAGDALLNYAFETMTRAFPMECDLRAAATALEIMSHKAGIQGMIGGQVVDVESEKKGEKITGDKLLFIHENKTAALIEASLMVGAVLAGASETDIDKIAKIGSNIGIAFQIQDDILDIEGNFEELGKPIGSDLENDKATYVSIFGIEKAKEDVKRLTDEAVALLEELPGDSSFLKELMMSLVNRTH